MLVIAVLLAIFSAGGGLCLVLAQHFDDATWSAAFFVSSSALFVGAGLLFAARVIADRLQKIIKLAR